MMIWLTISALRCLSWVMISIRCIRILQATPSVRSHQLTNSNSSNSLPSRTKVSPKDHSTNTPNCILTKKRGPLLISRPLMMNCLTLLSWITWAMMISTVLRMGMEICHFYLAEETKSLTFNNQVLIATTCAWWWTTYNRATCRAVSLCTIQVSLMMLL